MNKCILGLILLILSQFEIKAQEYSIQGEQSKIRWTGRKVTGNHVGFLQTGSGYIKLEEDKLVNGRISIDMNSLTCTDIKDEKNNAKLVRHLKNPDFFSADSFPTSTFEIQEATSSEGSAFLIKGILTIKGISKPYEFRVNLEKKATDIIVSGKITVDRTLFNIRYKSSSFFDGLGDRMIYDDFDLDLYLVFNSKS